MDDLRKVMRQPGVLLECSYSDYELHGTMVGQAEERNRVSHHLQGASNRADRRRLIQQAAEIDALNDRLERLRRQQQGQIQVFYPVDCVSHDACLRVKRHCRQQEKRFMPLRSSGLSAFAAGLRQCCLPQAERRPERQARPVEPGH
jgi:hypothetical protein